MATTAPPAATPSPAPAASPAPSQPTAAAPAAPVSANAAANAPRAVTPAEVGWQFVPQYYTFVNKQPHKLHCFYNRNSTFVHGTEGEDVKHLSGQAQIHDKIVSLGFTDCKVYINSVDAQSSTGGGIVIQVIGEMSNRGEPWRKFAQTFFLAEQPNGYYVLNDIFRFLKEETLADGAEEELVEQARDSGEEPGQLEGVTMAAPEQAPINGSGSGSANGFHPELEKEAEPEPEAEPEVPAAEEDAEEEAAPAQEEEEEAPAVVEDVIPPQPDQPAVSIVVAPEPAAPAPAAEPAPEPAEEAPAAPSPPAAEPEPAPAKVEDAKPAAPAPSAPAAPTPAPAPAQPAAPAHAPEPSKPTGPKTWAALASKDSNRWGANVASDARGVSAAPPPQPVPKPVQQGGAGAGSGFGMAGGMGRGASVGGAPGAVGAGAGEREMHPAAQAAMQVATAQCFVKSVTEQIPNSALRDTLTARFGGIKELEIVRSKACAFLEFTTLDAARRAILASLPQSQGGEGGIRIPLPEGGEGRVSVEMRKERGERPVSTRGRGMERGAFRGGRGVERGRGGGAPPVAGGERGRGRGVVAGK